MPIKDWSKYPKNWKSEIRPAILKRANHCCEECGVENGDYGYRDLSGKYYSSQEIHDALEKYGYDYFDNELKHCFDKKGNPTKPIKIVLTIALLDHDVTNNDHSNLKALCQYHHLRLDSQQHRINAKETLRKKKGLQELF